MCTYRMIKKSPCTWWLQYRKLQVMFKVSPASLQTFIDTPNCVLEGRVQYSTVHIPNVFCGWNCLKYCIFVCFLYCNHQLHRDFLITLHILTLNLIKLTLLSCTSDSCYSVINLYNQLYMHQNIYTYQTLTLRWLMSYIWSTHSWCF
jgi:hypothetical protein